MVAYQIKMCSEFLMLLFIVLKGFRYWRNKTTFDFFFLIRSMNYSFNLKRDTAEKAYKHWEKITNNYTPLPSMNPRAQQYFWVCILTFLGLFSWALVVGSLKGKILLVVFGLVSPWAKEENIWKPKTDFWPQRTIGKPVSAQQRRVLGSMSKLQPAQLNSCLSPYSGSPDWQPPESENRYLPLFFRPPTRLAKQHKVSQKPPFLQSDKTWDPDRRNPPEPKTPQIKQKEGSHSIWRLDLK